MKPVITFLALTILFVSASPVKASDPADKLAAVTEMHARSCLEHIVDLADAQMSPMLREIKAVVDSCRQAEAPLRAEFKAFSAAADDGGALGAKAEIEYLKRDTQLKILRIQARHARLAGRDDLAQHIEKTLAGLLSPALMRRHDHLAGNN